MTAIFSSLLWFWRSLSIGRQLIAIGAVVAVIIVGAGGVYAWIDHQGYARATLEWSTKYAKREAELEKQRADELARQKAINEAAIADLDQKIDLYKDELLQAAALEEQLAKEAAKDPEANRVALDRDAVARYNRSIAK